MADEKMARKSGAELVGIDRIWRRLVPDNPRLEYDVGIIRALDTAT